MARRGPNTPNGKAVSSKNAITHGLTSLAPVIPGEEEAQWRAFRDGVVEDCDPQGTLERALAARIASLLWRLERVVRYEAAGITEQIADASGHLAIAEEYSNLFSEPVPSDFQAPGDEDAGEGEEAEGNEVDPDIAELAELRIIPRGFHLDRILRYEPHLHRMLTQTIHELEARQSRRRGERPHLARLDVSGAP